MFYKELDVIRSTEDKAELIIAEAEAKAKSLGIAAKKEAEDIKIKSERDDDKVFNEFVEEGKAIAKYNYDNQLDAAKKEAKIMSSNAEKNAPKAIDVIFERIVVDSVNS